MNTRKKFLLQGSMAAAALFAAKPFKIFANPLAAGTGFTINNNKLFFVHTGNYKSANRDQTIKHIAGLKNSTANLVLLQAGNMTGQDAPQMKYDASMNPGNEIPLIANHYKIIYKGHLKIGIITEGETNTIESINILSAYLKKEEKCHIVAYLSQLGYKTNNGLDDLSLAAASTNLDIIFGGHAKTFCKGPFITRNKNKEEVIINHAAGNNLALGQMEIAFDSYGKKRHIAFNNELSRERITKRS